MDHMIRINEADSIALHGMAFLGCKPNQWVPGKAIAEALQVSQHHLHKVFRQLETQGLVRSIPGPWGGYKLAKPSEEISLLEIYEAIEGKFKPRDCLLEQRVCQGKECLLGGFLKKMNQEFRDYLTRTKLSEFRDLYPSKKGGRNEKKNHKN